MAGQYHYMQSHFLTYKSSMIHYYRAGNGNRLLFCFHGYGESGQSFSLLEDHTGKDFSMISIDLPFHGKTDWKEGLDFTPQQLKEIMELAAGDLYSAPIYLLGYSLGGRIALGLLELIADKTKKIVLLAPDGLKLSRWYRLATQSRLGNRLFRFTMKNPGWLFSLMSVAGKIGKGNPGIYKFGNNYIRDKQSRDELYKRWTSMRRFKPNLVAIKSLILKHQIPVRLLYGRHDRVMRFEHGEKFRKGIDTFCDLTILPAGHQLLQEKNLETIIQLLKI